MLPPEWPCSTPTFQTHESTWPALGLPCTALQHTSLSCFPSLSDLIFHVVFSSLSPEMVVSPGTFFSLPLSPWLSCSWPGLSLTPQFPD